MRLRTVAAGLIVLAAGVLIYRRTRPSDRSAAPLSSTPIATLPPAPRFLSVAWELVEPVADDELALRFQRSERMTLDRIDVQETPTQVFVTVLVRWEPPVGGWFAFEVEERATVKLSRPLRGRDVVHAATDPLYP
jgi:hypothetical protein